MATPIVLLMMALAGFTIAGIVVHTAYKGDHLQFIQDIGVHRRKKK